MQPVAVVQVGGGGGVQPVAVVQGAVGCVVPVPPLGGGVTPPVVPPVGGLLGSALGGGGGCQLPVPPTGAPPLLGKAVPGGLAGWNPGGTAVPEPPPVTTPPAPTLPMKGGAFTVMVPSALRTAPLGIAVPAGGAGRITDPSAFTLIGCTCGCCWKPLAGGVGN